MKEHQFRPALGIWDPRFVNMSGGPKAMRLLDSSRKDELEHPGDSCRPSQRDYGATNIGLGSGGPWSLRIFLGAANKL